MEGDTTVVRKRADKVNVGGEILGGGKDQFVVKWE